MFNRHRYFWECSLDLYVCRTSQCLNIILNWSLAQEVSQVRLPCPNSLDSSLWSIEEFVLAMHLLREYTLSSVQSLSRVRLFATPWIAARQASLSITNSRSSLRLSRWCHPAISSSVVPFSSCPQSSPASGSFQMSLVFTLIGQSIGVSASTIFPMNTQDWSP